jgi:hypothetical protein
MTGKKVFFKHTVSIADLGFIVNCKKLNTKVLNYRKIMAFTKLEPNSVNSAASFTFAEVTAGNIKTDNLQYANGDIWTFGSYITGASGANTQVQFNTDGNFDASSAFTFDSDTSTLTATNIQGNGAGLSHLTGANVTGEVTHAASANAVAGANVSGEVSFAATANAVAGANVSGEVLNAAIANSVAGANISGQVANALVAGTVYTNAQPNITSVGTLSSLAVTTTLTAGDATFNSGSISTDLTVTGNLTVSGTTTTVSTVNITSSNTTITLHDPGHELYSDDGKDIGILMRIFNSADDHAFFGRAADTGAIEYCVHWNLWKHQGCKFHIKCVYRYCTVHSKLNYPGS